jgi:hypothetical protein
MPHLTNAKENELKRLKTTTNEGILSDEDFGPQKAREDPLLGIGEERERWDTDSIWGFLKL